MTVSAGAGGGSNLTAKEERKRRFITDCLYFALIAGIFWLIVRYLLGLILPFIIGYLIAALVQPAVALLHRRLKLNRRAAGILMVLLFVLTFGLLIGLCITSIVSELAAVAAMLPGLFEQISSAVMHVSGRISGYINSLPVEYSERLAGELSNVSNEMIRLSSLSSGVISTVLGMVSAVPGLMVDTIVTIIAACFFSMDYLRIRGFVLLQLPERHRQVVCDIKEFLFETVAKLIRAYLTLMLITFSELAAGLLLLRVPHAVTIAAVISIVDILPVLGTGSVMIPWTVIELILGNVTLAAGLGVLYAVIAVVRNILEPKIVGHHIGLYPLITLMSMFLGLKCFGFAGMFLFPITVIILKHLQDTGKIRLWQDERAEPIKTNKK